MQDRFKETGVQILDWYNKNKRDLPWRHTKDPYKIWISEIMLQQTRVDTVIDYYQRFLQRFPDVCALAQAEEAEVLSLWQGLGYYSRARNLHRAARLIAERYGGRFPRTYEEVRELPGIGEYTAGAVTSIAFDLPCPAVDGNVLRVVARLEGLAENITADKTKKAVTDMVVRMIPSENAGDFSQGMMELGALVCIPAEPLCDKCPVKSLCTAFVTGRQNELPMRKKSKPSRELSLWAAVIRGDGCILLEHRREETLLAQMWGVPLVEKAEGSTMEELFLAKYGLKLQQKRKLGKVKHVFTHQVWNMEAVLCRIPPDNTLPPNMEWVRDEDLKVVAVPTAFRKVLRLAEQEDGWEQIEMDV